MSILDPVAYVEISRTALCFRRGKEPQRTGISNSSCSLSR